MDSKYVVFEGREPGIYSSWADCKAQVHRFSGCVFKKYPSADKACEAWEEYQRLHDQGGDSESSSSRGSVRNRHAAKRSQENDTVFLDDLRDVMSSIADEYDIQGDTVKVPSAIEFAEEREFEVGVLDFSMQKWLERVCQTD
ncbi:hypothetical protein RIF29_14341 [Crotalaria pallida]|uniref:Ribonuclease H1 N-terminal domain-containing protein n=1 Tax=Crotalaria pallida TaxID=3830 RepID=A0AAN9IBI6_CROPI